MVYESECDEHLDCFSLVFDYNYAIISHVKELLSILYFSTIKLNIFFFNLTYLIALIMIIISLS